MEYLQELEVPGGGVLLLMVFRPVPLADHNFQLFPEMLFDPPDMRCQADVLDLAGFVDILDS